MRAKFLILATLFLATAAHAQFSTVSRGPLSGGCNPPALGLDIVNNVTYSCGGSPPQWAAGSGGSGLPSGCTGASGAISCNSVGVAYNAPNGGSSANYFQGNSNTLPNRVSIGDNAAQCPLIAGAFNFCPILGVMHVFDETGLDLGSFLNVINLGQASGPAVLNGSAILPANELATNSANCNSTTFYRGDSTCANPGSANTITVANSASPGTTLNYPAWINSSGLAISGPTVVRADGIVSQNAGTTGTATISRGPTSCQFVNGPTQGDYVIIDAGTGQCRDGGATTANALSNAAGSGFNAGQSNQILGRVFATNAGAGVYAICFGTDCDGTAIAVDGTSFPASAAVLGTSNLRQPQPATADQIAGAVSPLYCHDTSGSGTAQSCSTTPASGVSLGTCINYTTTTANTGSLTLSVNAATATNVLKWQGTALAAGDIPANRPVKLCADNASPPNWYADTIGNAPAGSGPPFTYAQGTITTSAPWMNHTATWNAGGTTFQNFLENITCTAAAASSSLAQWQIGGLNVFNLYGTNANCGAMTIDMANGSNTPVVRFKLANPNLIFASAGLFQFTTGNAGGTVDLCLERFGATTFGFGTNSSCSNTSALLLAGNTCRITAAVTLSTSATTVCSWSLPAVAQAWAWQCTLPYAITAGTTPTLTIGMNASQAPTNETGYASINSTNTGTSTQGTASASASGNTNILTGASVANGTYLSTTSGTIQASATAGTFAITATLGGTTPAGTIPVGATCTLN